MSKAEQLHDQIHTALFWSNQFLTSRDEMNSAIHVDDVRYSPLTKLMGPAFDALEELYDLAWKYEDLQD